MASRSGFNSRLGFVLAAVGSAVGLGNLWGFPYRVSESGGGAFVLVYLILLLLIGIPALMAELSVGRRAGTGAAGAFPTRTGNANWIGFFAIFASVLLLAYYSVIAGWSLRYFLDGFVGTFFDDASGYFTSIAEGGSAIGFHLLFMVITLLVVVRGVGGGIEKANFVMMPFLFLFVIGLAIYGNLQDGASAGRAFYLDTDFGKLSWGDVSDAASQTFFSIGLGLGTMLTFSSYLGKKENLQSTGTTIALADTGVAILAGFMVFPLLFSLGLDDLITSGSSVGGLFIVLPSAFGEIGGGLGIFMAVGFFLALTFAALSSAISLLEVPVAALVDKWGVDRKRASILMTLGIYTFGIPTALDLDMMDLYDLVLNKFVLIGSGLLLVVYAGWIRKGVLEELDVGVGRLNFAPFLRFFIRFPLPVFLAILYVVGFVDGVKTLIA